MSVAVIVPWRPGVCAHRQAAWDLVRERWSAARWAQTELVVFDDGGEPFSRAASINQAIEQHDADVYVLADADTLVDLIQVEAAVVRASASPGLVVAFDRFRHLGARGTQMVLAGEEPCEEWIEWQLPNTWSSCVAVSRDTWIRAEGFDPKFRGWGMEDVAFDIACRTLAGPTRRVEGDAWHLWHPQDRVRPAENVALLRQYEAADGDPDAVRALRAA